jgi:hypothetical protein
MTYWEKVESVGSVQIQRIAIGSDRTPYLYWDIVA